MLTTCSYSMLGNRSQFVTSTRAAYALTAISTQAFYVANLFICIDAESRLYFAPSKGPSRANDPAQDLLHGLVTRRSRFFHYTLSNTVIADYVSNVSPSGVYLLLTLGPSLLGMYHLLIHLQSPVSSPSPRGDLAQDVRIRKCLKLINNY